MGRVREVKPGLTLRDHQYLATEIGALGEALEEIRAVIRTSDGSGTPAHQAIGRVVYALKSLRDLLRHDLRDTHGDRAELQALYSPGHGEGA